MKGQINLLDEMIIDNFAGGGGTSTGIELAVGRPVDVAINHDPASIQMHCKNHPYTRHYCEDVWEVDPKEVTQGRPVALCWFSPDCKHFSKAKGGKPREKKIRGLAWVAVRWAATVKPRVIILENVEEFKTWGPLNDEGYPIKEQQGRTFRSFINALKKLGYEVEWKELRACDYGAPTIRKRFFLIARCDGEEIIFPEPTHGEGLKPYRTASECIDWSIPTKSIFGRKKPLADNTMARIARGTDKFVIKANKPFLIPVGYGEREGQKPRLHNIEDPLSTIVSTVKQALVTPHLIQYHTETAKGEHRGQKLTEPIMTIDGSPRYGLATAYISKYYAGGYKGAGSGIDEPVPTVTTVDHNSLAAAYLAEYYSTGRPISVEEPLHTATTRDRNALIQVKVIRAEDEVDLQHWPGVRAMLNQYCDYDLKDDEVLVFDIAGILYFIADIGLRMLEPRELYNAQGFPPDYCIDFDVNGKKYSKKEQVARCGNSVPPPFAEALVRSNLPEMCGKKYATMNELEKDIAV
ncbi:DNA (cytosine-5)-methyltransferase 1 [Clostridiales Family XIII bacterium PM5-7]